MNLVFDENRMKTLKHSAVTVFLLFWIVLVAQNYPAKADDYTLTALVSLETDFSSSFSPGTPAINNIGQVAYSQFVFNLTTGRNEVSVFVDDGTGPVELVNLTQAGINGIKSAVVINDNGAVALSGSLLVSGFLRGVIVRVEPDGTVKILAEAISDGTGDFLEFSQFVSINNSGQVTALARNNDNTNSILLLGDSGITEIARSSASLFSLSSPTVNDLGVVAFKAVDPLFPAGSIFTGTGGPLTNEGTNPGSGSSSFIPVINNDGIVLSDSGFPLLYTALGGMVDSIVAGTEDPYFRILGGTSNYGFNDFSEIAFVTGSGPTVPLAFSKGGLFTGNDPVNDLILAVGDTIFGGTLLGQAAGGHPIRLGSQSINNSSQIVFNVMTGRRNVEDPQVVHVVLATPIGNEPPVANAGPDQTAECANPLGPQVTLDGSGSTDPDNDPLTYTWSGSFLENGGTVTGANPTVTLLPDLGTSAITLVVDDGQADSKDTVDITVEDTTPPGVVASLTLVGNGDEEGDDDEGLFQVGFSASDNCDPAPTVTAVLAAGVAPNVTEIEVADGQVFESEFEDDEIEIEIENGVLEIEAPNLNLIVAATDASGNSAVAEVEPSGISGDNDHDTLSAELDD